MSFLKQARISRFERGLPQSATCVVAIFSIPEGCPLFFPVQWHALHDQLASAIALLPFRYF